MRPGARRHPASFVDAHVHLHPCFDLAAQLDAAHENFARAARALGWQPGAAVLLLAQASGDEGFERLAAPAAGGEPRPGPGGRWTFHPTAEPESIAARRGDGAELRLVCGRQVRASEGIEVLALGTLRRFEDGRPAAALLAEAGAAGALPVLPWGVGKWLGRRGRVVRDLIERAAPPPACGDSGNRPRLWPTPRLLRLARRRGLRVLPGSDPLPLPSEERRAGSFGFALPGALSPERPAADLLRLIADPDTVTVPFGRLEGALRFVVNQIALRRAQRGGPRPG